MPSCATAVISSASTPDDVARAEDRRIRALRPPRPPVEPWRPIDWQREVEWRDDVEEHALVIFLAGAECPFTCVFCDLWRYTTEEPTPAGAIPEQIRIALDQAIRDAAGSDDTTREIDVFEADCIKLYNASNFFEKRAVPPEDDPAIARAVAGFRRVVVECHPRLVVRRCFDFAARLDGRLEVAMGFETAHPEALSRLNKRVDLDDLRRAARDLRANGIGVRAFVLLGAPFVPPDAALDWLERSVEFALDQGAEIVSLIPVRGGEGELARLERAGAFQPPDLDAVEAGFERCRRLSDRVRLDAWDLDRLAPTDPDAATRERLARLRRLGAGRPERVPA